LADITSTIVGETAMSRKRGGSSENFKIKLTKVDVAAESLKAAVRLFFEDTYPSAVYLLAASAREITTTLADKIGADSLLTECAEALGLSRVALIKTVHRFASFMKHANRDPQSIIELPYKDVEAVLFIAYNEFFRTTGGMPPEAHIFEVWCFLTNFQRITDAPLRTQPELRRLIPKFPGIRRASPTARKQIGLKVLNESAANGLWGSDYKRSVELPGKTS